MQFKKIAVAAIMSACAASSFAAGSSFLNNADAQLNISGDSSQTFTFFVAAGGLTLGSTNNFLSADWDLNSVTLDNSITFSQIKDIHSDGFEKWVGGAGQSLAAGSHTLTVTVGSGWQSDFTYNGKLIANSGKFSATNPVTIAVVPEPESYAMLLAGLGALGFMGRRRKPKQG